MLLAVNLDASSSEGEDKGEADLVRIPSQHENNLPINGELHSLAAANFFLFQRVDSNIATRLINFEDEIKVFAELFLTR